MKLLLTSSGNTNKSIENSLLELLGKPFNEANIIFIPTAANVEEDITGWLNVDIENFRRLGFKEFGIVDISKGKKDEWLPKFENADILVFGGGNEKYLLEQIRKTGIEDFLKKFVETGVYVGISAGSMSTAKSLSLNDSGKLYYEDFNHGDKMNGLGFVDFEIRPHLNSSYFPQVRVEILADLAPKVDHPIYAIDDNTAVKVVDDKIDVVSEGEWKRFN